MIKIDLKVIDTFFTELIEILKDPNVTKSQVFVTYGKVSVAIHTYKEQLSEVSKGNKENLMKNQKTIKMLDEVEKAMTAKLNSPLDEIKKSVNTGYKIFNNFS